ncbi:MAG: polyphenol oxidase family protein [bacterium]
MSRPPGFSFVDAKPGWRVGRFAHLDGIPGIVHLVTTRRAPLLGTKADDGEMKAAVSSLTNALGLADTAWCRQVHGDRVLVVQCGGMAGEADALITATPGLGLLGRSADCPLVLAVGPLDGASDRNAPKMPTPSGRPRYAVGFAHASWRSTVAGITSRMVQRLGREFGLEPENIMAGICPAAGPCCYEVGDEVRTAAVAGLGEVAAGFFRQHGPKLHFDLWQANARQLQVAGVPEDQIVTAGLCTICRNDLFPSFRVEGQAASRFAGVVGILPMASG